MVREASKRVLGLRPFDVQLIGWSSIFIHLFVDKEPKYAPVTSSRTSMVMLLREERRVVAVPWANGF